MQQKRFNHSFGISFALISGDADTNATAQELLAALEKQVAYFRAHPDKIVAACRSDRYSYEMPSELNPEFLRGVMVRVAGMLNGDAVSKVIQVPTENIEVDSLILDRAVRMVKPGGLEDDGGWEDENGFVVRIEDVGQITHLEARIERTTQSVAESAQEAFWAEVVRQHPEIKAGDFPPDMQMQMNDLLERAVEVWVDGNSPDADEESSSPKMRG